MTQPELIAETARAQIRMSESVAISAVSIYELDFKTSRNRWPNLTIDIAERLVLETDAVGIEIVSLDADLLSKSARLDWSHGDPFDRMIVATARYRRATLVSADRAVISQSIVETLEA